MTHRDNVMFIIPHGLNIPAGEHPGYIDWGGKPSDQMAAMSRAVLRLKRSDQGAPYSEIDITDLISTGNINFNFMAGELDESDRALLKAALDSFSEEQATARRRKKRIGTALAIILAGMFLYWLFAMTR